MARPRTALGTSGALTVVGQILNESGRWVAAPRGTKAVRFRARTKFRDSDGRLRDVERFAPSRAMAETRLKAALLNRQAPRDGGDLRPDTTLAVASDTWLALVERSDSNLSDNTRNQYRAARDRYVSGSAISELTLRELNRVAVLEGYLKGLADRHGTGAAKTARSVVANVLALAVRYGALDFNAMRDVRPAKAAKPRQTNRDTSRALTRDERDHLLKTAGTHEPTNHLDVADIAWWLAGTGVRISEALSQRWDDVELEPGTVLVRGTKTAASTRRLTLPGWLLGRIEERAAEIGTEGLLFPSPGLYDRDRPRDRRNVARALRLILNDAGFPWATPHTFRRTVASLIDGAGLPIALAANQLGHADPAMTARVYLGRKGDTAAAAAVL